MDNQFAAVSALIQGDLEEQLKALLSNLQVPVKLTCIAGNSEKDQEMGAFLNHLTSLNENLSCSFLSPGENPDWDQALDSIMLPATGIGAPGAVPRMVFHGVPGGKEISSFLSALLTVGGGAKPLDKYTLKDIAKVRKPMCLQVCVSLACQHCAQLAANAMRTAFENPMITAHTIDANLYPELVKKYNIERVPLLIVNGDQLYPGGKTMAELTGLLAKIK